MKDLDYPFNSDYIIRKKKSLKKQLLADENTKYIGKKIAILGGETTENIKLVLELFLLNYGIRPDFYESEYNRYYEDGMFPNSDLEEFKPDIIYVCTCVRIIIEWPVMTDSKIDVDTKRQALMDKFTGLWDTMAAKYHCPIIQNNFEYPFFRLMGNKDASDYHGRINYVTSLNMAFYVSYLILIPIIMIVTFILVGNIFDASLEQEMMEELSSYRMIYQIVYMFLSGGFISSFYVFIYIFKKGILRFQWWFIFWISFAVSILTIICSILLLCLYGYAFYKGVIKKGKNH